MSMRFCHWDSDQQSTDMYDSSYLIVSHNMHTSQIFVLTLLKRYFNLNTKSV